MLNEILVQRGERHSAPAVEAWKKIGHHQPSNKLCLQRGRYLCFVIDVRNDSWQTASEMIFEGEELFPFATPGSKIIFVTSDNNASRDEVRAKMRECLDDNRNIDIDLISVDLRDFNNIKVELDNTIQRHKKDYDHVIFINNTTHISHASDQHHRQQQDKKFKSCYDNFKSRMYLMTESCRHFYRSEQTVVHAYHYDNLRLKQPSDNFNLPAERGLRTTKKTFSIGPKSSDGFLIRYKNEASENEVMNKNNDTEKCFDEKSQRQSFTSIKTIYIKSKKTSINKCDAKTTS